MLSISWIFPFFPQFPLQNGLSLLSHILQLLCDEPLSDSPLASTVIHNITIFSLHLSQHPWRAAEQPSPKVLLHSEFQQHPFLYLTSQGFCSAQLFAPFYRYSCCHCGNSAVTTEISDCVISMRCGSHSTPHREVYQNHKLWGAWRRGPRSAASSGGHRCASGEREGWGRPQFDTWHDFFKVK